MLRQLEGQQGPDEDGPGTGASGTRELPAGRPGARRRSQAHQRERCGPGHGVRHRQCHCHCGWPFCKWHTQMKSNTDPCRPKGAVQDIHTCNGENALETKT